MSDLLAEHAARVNASDRNVRLGKILWYTVPASVSVSHMDMLQGLLAVGISSAMPPVPRGYDIFRRVCSGSQLKNVPTSNPDVFENYLIRDIAGRGENVIVRRIVVESRDSKGRKLDYHQLRDVEFNKTTESISIKDLPDRVQLVPTYSAFTSNVFPSAHDFQFPKSVEITDAIRTEFIAQSGMLNPYTIREFVRKMVLQAGATMIREGGGVYFVMEENAAQVEALEEFVNKLPGDASMHSLPLIDDLKQRQMIKRAFEAETVDAVDEILAEAHDIVSSGTKITADRYRRMCDDFENLTRKTNQYEELLETGLSEAKSRMGLFQASIMGLRNSVKD